MTGTVVMMQPATFPVGIPLVSPMPVAAAPVLVLGLPLPLPPLPRSLTSPAPTPPSNLTLTEPSISPLPEPTSTSPATPIQMTRSGSSRPRSTNSETTKPIKKLGRSVLHSEPGDEKLPFRRKGEKAPSMYHTRAYGYRYGVDRMNNHRAWLKDHLMHVFSRDEEGPEIVKLLTHQYPTPEEYDATPYGDKLRRQHFLKYAEEVEKVWDVKLCAQMYSYSGATLRGYDRGRKVLESEYGHEEGWKRRMIEVGGDQLPVPVPGFAHRQEIATYRDETCGESGIQVIHVLGT